MNSPYERRPDGRFIIQLATYSLSGKFRGVRAGDMFTYHGQRYRVTFDIDSVYDGSLIYIVGAEAIA